MKKWRKRLRAFSFIALALLAASAVYAFARFEQLRSVPPVVGPGLPNANPFDAPGSLFESYPNPFEREARRPLFAAQALVAAGRVSFPVEALGGCESEEACRAYCEELRHAGACIAFAEAHGLLNGEELARARKFASAREGPGGCRTRGECEAHCGTLVHLEECVVFAEQYGVLPPEKLREAKAIAAYLRGGGVMPGGCATREACEAYCSVAAHMEACVAFAEETGVLPPEELQAAKRVLPFLVRGETPGGCLSKSACDAYCAEFSHMSECLSFAEKANLIPQGELKLAKRVLPFMLRGETPGGCATREACETYCRKSANWRECLTFAERAGIMNRIEIGILKQALKLIP